MPSIDDKINLLIKQLEPRFEKLLKETVSLYKLSGTSYTEDELDNIYESMENRLLELNEKNEFFADDLIKMVTYNFISALVCSIEETEEFQGAISK